MKSFLPTLGRLNVAIIQRLFRRLVEDFFAFFCRKNMGENPGFPCCFQNRNRFKSMEYTWRWL
jgi:hypothetical protein